MGKSNSCFEPIGGVLDAFHDPSRNSVLAADYLACLGGTIRTYLVGRCVNMNAKNVKNMRPSSRTFRFCTLGTPGTSKYYTDQPVP